MLLIWLQPDPISYPFIYATYKARGNTCRFTLSMPLAELVQAYYFHAAKNSVFTNAIYEKFDFSNYYAYIIFKPSRFLLMWRFRFNVLRDTGILDFWIKGYMVWLRKESSSQSGRFQLIWPFSYAMKPRIDECLLENRKTTYATKRSLSLRDLSGAFFILGLGLFLSFSAYLLECLTGRR